MVGWKRLNERSDAKTTEKYGTVAKKKRRNSNLCVLCVSYASNQENSKNVPKACVSYQYPT